MLIAVIFDNLGPYHIARLTALSADAALVAIQSVSKSKQYDWAGTEQSNAFRLETIGVRPIADILTSTRPDVVAIPGWSSKHAISACEWAVENCKPVVVMSASTRDDAKRSFFKEYLKYRFLRLASAGVVGGTKHKAYFAELGMPNGNIFMGYDTVDNGYFMDSTNRLSADVFSLRRRLDLPENYFIASKRFIKKKNILLLLDAYRDYLNKSAESSWDLVMLGDGPLRGEVEAKIDSLKLHEKVHLVGFKQYAELPAYFALAGGFVHASTVEQWGLVVNEAMACGLPVLVSDRCGCTPDLIENGINGWTFDPTKRTEISDSLLRLASMTETARAKMGSESLRIISDWGTDRFAKGMLDAIASIDVTKKHKAGFIDRTILRLMHRYCK